jgi:ubiquinone/menaquinone biosynthesis C-methylase UbiE
MKRDFDTAAKTWDLNSERMRMSTAVADAMVGALGLQGKETLMDYGTGTGTVALRMQPLVRDVIAADSSRGMLEVLDAKLLSLGVHNVHTVVLDLEREPSSLPSHLRPDVVVSVMALHHIADTAGFVATLSRLLPAGGRVAVADLDTEAGDFHADNTGVEHFGFDRSELTRTFEGAGFDRVRMTTAYDFVRLSPDGSQKTYPIFLLTAHKR